MLYEPVRIGMIGCDGYARAVIKRLWTMPHDGNITAVMSPVRHTPGAEACRRRGIPVFDSVEAMLAAGGFEVVINATPIHLHASLCRKCLEAGYSVWMEKPPTATIQDLDDLVAVSERTGLQVAVCFNSLYSHLAQELKRELVAGQYGSVRRVRGVGAWVRSEGYFTRNAWAGRVRLGEAWVLDGCLNNPFAHVVCNGLFFAGPGLHALAEPLSVEAELYRANAIESEDTSSLRVRTREGVEVLAHFSLAPEQEIAPATVIETDQAVIRLVNFATLHIRWHDGRSEARESYREDRIEMFQHLCRAARLNERYHCDLPMCRPFTLVVNAAFDAAGEVTALPDTYLRRSDREEGPAVIVHGINEHLHEAHEVGRLFSEIGVPWAVPGQKQGVEGYGRFPMRFGCSAPSNTHPQSCA